MQTNPFKISTYTLTPKENAIFSAFQTQILLKAEILFIKTPDKLPIYTSSSHLIRLLVARDFQQQKAYEMWLKWVDWRAEFNIDSLTEEIIESELQTGKAFWHKEDKKGHPCLIVKTKRHFPGESDIDTLMKFAVFLIEKGTEKADKTGDGRVCVLWDRKGFTMKNFDKRFLGLMKKLAGILQDNYAERLDCLYVLHPNWFFKAMFKVIKPFLNKKTKEKIKLINNTKELEVFFDKSSLMRDMGGSSDYVYQYKSFIVNDEVLGDIKKEDKEIKNKTKEFLKEEGYEISGSGSDDGD